MIWRNLGFIALFFIGCLLLTMLWLRWYTHHGQELTLPSYIDMSLAEAQKDAGDKSFEIVVIDSVFIVGQPGNIILDQNPPANSIVKQERKIYVTTTKDEAELIPFRRLPVLYGKSYNRKEMELQQGFELETKVVGRRYDSGAPDHILEVIYNGETVVNSNFRKDNVMVEKGGTLEMILSKSSGGPITMPSLTCKAYTEVQFLVETLNLALGATESDETVTNIDDSFVWKQTPSANSRIYTGDTVTLFLTQDLPSDCPDQ